MSHCRKYDECFFPTLNFYTRAEERMYSENCLKEGGTCDMARLDGIEFKVEERVAKCMRGFKTE